MTLYQHDPDLRHRILYTVLLLLLFHFLAAIPVLIVDEEQLQHLMADNPLLGVYELFAGGEVLTHHFPLVATGIFPYLMARMLAHFATYFCWLAPSICNLRRQDQEERKKKFEFITNLFTIPLAFFFAWGISQYLAHQPGLFPGHIHLFTLETFFSSLMMVCFVTAGGLISTWIIHSITMYGIGSGVDILLFSGASLSFFKKTVQIVLELPDTSIVIQRFCFFVIGGLVMVALSYFLFKAKRIIIIWSPTLLTKKKLPIYSVIPFKLNSGGILPLSASIGLLTLMRLAEDVLESIFGFKLSVFGHELTGWVTPSNVFFGWCLPA